MKNNSKKSPLTNKVIDKIQCDQIKIRPKIYFVLRITLVALTTLFVVLFILYLVSFIIFNLRASGVWFLPGFGFPALGVFFISLPWFLILIALILIIVLELLVKHFRFAYRRPILYSILGIIIFTLLGSFAISKTHLHSDLFWKAREGKLSVVGGFYRGFGASKLSNVHCGMVSDTIDNGFYLETVKGEILTVIVTSTTRFPPKIVIKKDDKIIVMGKRDNGMVKAFGIRIIDDQFDIFERRPRRSR